jgi:hypothetical protein
MERKPDKYQEQELVAITLSIATLMVCFSFLIFR